MSRAFREFLGGFLECRARFARFASEFSNVARVSRDFDLNFRMSRAFRKILKTIENL